MQKKFIFVAIAGAAAVISLMFNTKTPPAVSTPPPQPIAAAQPQPEGPKAQPVVAPSSTKKEVAIAAEVEIPQQNDDEAYEQWRKSRQEEVQKLITEIVPESISLYMASQIEDDSFFLMERKKRQSDAQDEEWAYEAALELKSLIYTHPLSSDVAIKSIVCKQLMCEFIGVVSNTTSWAPIHQYVIENASNISFEDGTRYGDVNYVKDGTDYVYALYRYAKN